MTYGIVSLHDVAPATEEPSRRLLSLVERRGMRAALLVVPGPYRRDELRRDSPFTAWLRDASMRGHEIALHGWHHEGVDDPLGERGCVRRLKGAVLARGCAEFNLLGASEAERRIELGRAALGSIGIEPEGFTPPGWLASVATVDVLRRLGFRYTTDHLHVRRLDGPGIWRIPAFSQRPGGGLERAGAFATPRLAASTIRSGLPIRVALHPDDLGSEAATTANRRLLDLVAAAGWRTYAELVAGGIGAGIGGGPSGTAA